MTKKQALQLAYYIMNNELDEMEEYHDDEECPEYYQEVKEAIKVIKEMSKAF